MRVGSAHRLLFSIDYNRTIIYSKLHICKLLYDIQNIMQIIILLKCPGKFQLFHCSDVKKNSTSYQRLNLRANSSKGILFKIQDSFFPTDILSGIDLPDGSPMGFRLINILFVGCNTNCCRSVCIPTFPCTKVTADSASPG